MKILFIAPIPPPIDGQSKASNMVLEMVKKKYDVSVVNLSKKNLKNGKISLSRISDIFSVIKQVLQNRKKNDLIYVSIAESFLGNLRDLFIYVICYRDLDKIFIHMLGGAGMTTIINGNGIMTILNKFFLKKIGGVIVEGPLNFETFSKVVVPANIHIVPNFAEDFLFVTDNEIDFKYENIEIIEVLYLSNLIPGKGYEELLEAYLELNEFYKKQIKVTFVGGFESRKSEVEFLKKIQPENGIKYLGKFIDGNAKRDLYCNTHVFCLPTYYPFEGQPISILEAYATGCAVISSEHSGIPYIFKDKENGFLAKKKSVESLRIALENSVFEKEKLKLFGQKNKNEAKIKYRSTIFQDKIDKIFLNFYNKTNE
ncbi:glycosyltransferase family 4 protein [Kaistella antarctica]|uniref:Colanic acid biosynthesis glycosyltransferase WcaL n=1 Tax=Kaistella antarctica TaxID=266748 RepID=A0A3S5EUS9_9FLAO|nr:glycosyltransferase family 4 protein [Kaistella antarctica]SEW14996.1 Glycosyltransferase involved in cell wall bisynthesis [Kaistella antarctica]VEH99422.1 colanic acid biosynthesis glycosyltransferase WcaL [Kaistella antarctica]